MGAIHLAHTRQPGTPRFSSCMPSNHTEERIVSEPHNHCFKPSNHTEERIVAEPHNHCFKPSNHTQERIVSEPLFYAWPHRGTHCARTTVRKDWNMPASTPFSTDCVPNYRHPPPTHTHPTHPHKQQARGMEGHLVTHGPTATVLQL